jgi:hypothetical protein
VTRLVLVAALAVLASGCGGKSAQPKDDPATFAVQVVDRIVHNHYAQVWDDLHPTDQHVAALDEYVGCETRSPVIAVPRTVKVVSVKDESVGLGNGTFVDSKAVGVRLGFANNFQIVHTVHVVAAKGKWTWILPSWRFRDYRDGKCPTDAASSPAPSPS